MASMQNSFLWWVTAELYICGCSSDKISMYLSTKPYGITPYLYHKGVDFCDGPTQLQQNCLS
jgi:hypothetical protein